jgi:hypothetical protein
VIPLVFDEPAVDRTTPLRARESRVNWFLKSTRPHAVEGRRVVNDLYSRFPDTNGMLRRRLRSRNNLDLRTALDELFVHEQLSRRYRVEYEPVTASGGSPDFKLYDGPDHAATVEVVSLMDGPKWEHQRRRHGRIEDYLNRQLQPTTHFIDFDIEDWDDHTNLDDLVKWVSRTLEDLRANPRALPNGPLGLPKRRTITDRPRLTSTSGRRLTITRRKLATGLLPVVRRSAAGSTLRSASAGRSNARRRSTTSAASRSQSSSAWTTGCATWTTFLTR